MSDDALSYLQSKGLHVRRAGPNDIHIPCMFCHEDESKRGRLYVNVDPSANIPGLFMCHLCGEKGSLVKLKRHFGDVVEGVKDWSEASDRVREVLAASAAHYHDCLADRADVYDWLRARRGLSFDTIVDRQIGWATGGLYRFLRGEGFKTNEIMETGLVVEDGRANKLVDSLIDMVTIPYHVAGNVVMIRGRSWPYKGDGHPDERTDGPKYKTPSRQASRLYNSDVMWQEGDEVVVTEGELDTLVLHQHGYKAVGVPGAQTWQDTWDSYTLDVRRMYVVFDDDEAGHRGADKLQERFGAKVRKVFLPPADPGEKKNDPTEWLVGKGHSRDEFQALLDQANKGGLLISVDDAYEEFLALQGLPGLKFNVEELDSHILPGLLESQLMVVVAKTNAGKTLLLLNLFHRIAMSDPDAKILFISLEQTRGDWFERARRIHRFYNLEATDADALAFWRDRLYLVDKNRVTVDELHRSLDDFEYQVGEKPTFLAVDYLGYWAASFSGPRYERTSDAIMAMKEVAKDRRLRVITPQQVSRLVMEGSEPGLDSARDAGVIEETADFLIGLWSDDKAGSDADQAQGRLSAKLIKSRHGGKGATVKFRFAPHTLAIVPLVDASPGHSQLLKRAQAELDYKRIRDDVDDGRMPWERTVLRHRGLLPPVQISRQVGDRPEFLRHPGASEGRSHQPDLALLKGDG